MVNMDKDLASVGYMGPYGKYDLALGFLSEDDVPPLFDIGDDEEMRGLYGNGLRLVGFYEDTYLLCAVTDGAFGTYCGYVRVPESYGLEFGEEYDSSDSDWCRALDVHGGVTYASSHWIGFDCDHYGDWNNHSESLLPDYHDEYYALHKWTASEVMDECKRLAKQVHDLYLERKR